jgi:hypothetical protein
VFINAWERLGYLYIEVNLWPLKRPFGLGEAVGKDLSTLATDPPGQLDVLGHDGDPLGVDGAEVGVLKEANQVGLAGLLQGHDSRALEPEVGLEVLGNLPDQALEGQLPDEELSGLLVSPDLTESNCARPVPVGLLDTTGGGGTLPCSLGGQLLPGGLATSGLSCCLLGTSHCAGGSESTDARCLGAEIFIVLLPTHTQAPPLPPSPLRQRGEEGARVPANRSKGRGYKYYLVLACLHQFI